MLLTFRHFDFGQREPLVQLPRHQLGQTMPTSKCVKDVCDVNINFKPSTFLNSNKRVKLKGFQILTEN